METNKSINASAVEAITAMESHAGSGEYYVSFTLNGQIQHVPPTVPGDLTLNTYIREYARLKGTKFMCREGGCGICIVSLHFTHPATGQCRIVSVNSCMFPVLACHGLKVTTVEGIGSKETGYNEIQTRLANFYGTQCGYCSPGWVMSMYSFIEANPEATMKEIEDSFSSNLCRCTGYRPILDAFKSFASDRSEKLECQVKDIEELLKVCPKSGTMCHGSCKKEMSKRAPFDCVDGRGRDDCDIEFLEVALASPSLKLELHGGIQWYKVAYVDEIFEIFGMLRGSYRLIGGNTSIGILKEEPSPDVFIDLNGVKFLKSHSVSFKSLDVGANTTLADTITLFNAVADENPDCYSYLKELARHIEKVAHTAVRNVGTLAGNLSIKHRKRDFPSDIFLILETVGALLSIRGDSGCIDLISLQEFLETNMYKKVILQVILPPLSPACYIVKIYKVAPRAQNAIAHVNAGFMFKVDKTDKYRVLEPPRIVYGGISPFFVHAVQTERYLVSKKLLDETTLQGALNILSKEVQPDYKLPDPKPEYRKGLTQSLFYRVILSLKPNSVSDKFRSGGEDITRPLSSGEQEFGTDPSRPPLYQPLPKLESLLQCSGEAEFVYDIPPKGCDLYAAFVISKQGPAEFCGLDPSKALALPGVVAFFSAKDIPGKNTFTPNVIIFLPDQEQLFADKKILFAGQVVGLIVALTQEGADRAAKFVHIDYQNQEKPVLDVREVAKTQQSSRIFFSIGEPVIAPKPDVQKIIKGEFKMKDQYHFAMETLSCVSVPIEDGLDVYCSTQWPQVVQETIALVLNIPENSVNMKTRRLGGAFGIKVTRANQVGGACSLAAYLLQRPVRMVTRLEDMMEGFGKRYPCYFNYEVGVNSEGEIQYANTNVYEDNGSAFNDPVIQIFTFLSYKNVYDTTVWGTNMYDVKTDKPCNCWMRAPGSLEGVTIAEHILEHIAHEVNKDPLMVRIKNLEKTYPLPPLISMIKEKSNYEARQKAVEEFNKENVWKKRGISLVPSKFDVKTLGSFYALVSIFRNDGTVAIITGGIECGQGINTKAAQTCASALKLPLEMVTVKPSYSVTSPNNAPTAASVSSECVCYAVEQCCNELNDRLNPIRLQYPDYLWLEILQAAFVIGVQLSSLCMFSISTAFKNYSVFGATVLEVEVDILTGEHKVIRADILEDAGKSLNPFVDIGQIEGAFIMGLGYWTSEELIYDPETGRLLNNRTLNYKIPGAKDIPIDFRVYMVKNSDNPLGILGSKSLGEPPIVGSTSIMFAIRHALRSVRKDLGLPDTWLEMDAPFTGENIFLSTGIRADKYTL